MVPYFDPVPIEVAPGFRLTRGFNLANVLGLTKGKAIGVRTLVVLSPLAPLSNGPKIDYFSHSVAPRCTRVTLQFDAHLMRGIPITCADASAERRPCGARHETAFKQSALLRRGV